MIYSIDGKQMPQSIIEFMPEGNHLYGENTGRDEAGYNHLDLVRPDVRKWVFRHYMITRGQLNEIKAACNPRGFYFTGLSSAGEVTARCYANVTGEDCIAYFGDGEDQSFWAVQVSIIEM